MTNKMYTEEEMVEEIAVSIGEIGGTIIVMEPTADGFIGGYQLIIHPTLADQAELIIRDIKKKYMVKRGKMLAKNPFLGTQEFLDNC